MTPAERERWWLLHGSTHDGSPGDAFAKDLERRGILAQYDGIADVTYWIFTPAGKRAYFGVA
jgi:hypothetical protein